MLSQLLSPSLSLSHTRGNLKCISATKNHYQAAESKYRYTAVLTFTHQRTHTSPGNTTKHTKKMFLHSSSVQFRRACSLRFAREPHMLFCCCSPFASGFNILCVLTCFSAHRGDPVGRFSSDLSQPGVPSSRFYHTG